MADSKSVSIGSSSPSPFNRDIPHMSQQLAAESIMDDLQTLQGVSQSVRTPCEDHASNSRLVLALRTEEPGPDADEGHDDDADDETPSRMRIRSGFPSDTGPRILPVRHVEG
jgi:hypothetical protein